jgi:hypothetical protein
VLMRSTRAAALMEPCCTTAANTAMRRSSCIVKWDLRRFFDLNDFRVHCEAHIVTSIAT